MQLKPIRFISMVNDNQSTPHWKIDQEAIDYLSTIEQPLAIISIAGLYRTGKSFILNQFAGNMTGFDIGSTVQPCTEGIWLWEVHEKSIKEATPGWRYLLLDTEGLGSYVRTETYDVQLFCFALLLGSYFIYNSLNCIDEGAIDKLSFVVELTKHIRVKSEGDMDPHHLKLYFPSFLWLVRDFTLQLVMNGETLTPREYLNKALEPLKGDPDRVASKNKVREFIKAYFSDRDCFCLKRPLAEEEKLQSLSTLTLDQLRPEYLQQLVQLKSLVFSKVTPKKMNNTDITGPMLIEMAKTYVDAINEGMVPTISSAWENIVFQEAQKALTLAGNLYSSKMEEGLKSILEQEEFDKLHEKALSAALTLFRDKAIGGANVTYEPQLLGSIKTSHAKYKDQNMSKSRADCEQLLRTLATNIDDSIFGEVLTTQDLLSDEWKKKIFAYRQVARGPAKIELLVDFLENKIFDSVKKVSNYEAKQFKLEREEMLKQQQGRHDSEYQRLHLLYLELDTIKGKSEEKISSLQKELEIAQMTLQNWEEEKKELINISVELRKRLDPEFNPPPDYAAKKEALKNDKNCALM